MKTFKMSLSKALLTFDDSFYLGSQKHVVIPDYISNKMPRYFLTFLDEALRDLAPVISEKYDVSIIQLNNISSP